MLYIVERPSNNEMKLASYENIKGGIVRKFLIVASTAVDSWFDELGSLNKWDLWPDFMYSMKQVHVKLTFEVC